VPLPNKKDAPKAGDGIRPPLLGAGACEAGGEVCTKWWEQQTKLT